MKKHAPASPTRFIRYLPDDPLATRPELEIVPAPIASPGSPRVRLVPRGGPIPPPALYTPGSEEFLDWQLQEALRRGVELWASLAPSFRAWQGGRAELDVIADEGEDLNAFYDRAALHFFHRRDPVTRQVVRSGASVDVSCHEQGHAVLDALRPDLWDAASFEVSAFHEAFGDVSALLVVLQDERIRQDAVSETGGRLTRSNEVSRLAEQLGRAIRDIYGPGAAPRDCLREAAGDLAYVPPGRLPAQGPDAELTREPHSFSRVFTGAFYETLARTAEALASPADSAALLASSALHGAALARAVTLARRDVRWMKAVGEAWLAALETGPAREVCREVLTRRGILPGPQAEVAGTSRWDEREQFVRDLRASGRLLEPGRPMRACPGLPTHALLVRSGRPCLRRLRIE